MQLNKQKDRNYNSWQRDPLAIMIRDRAMAGEKLDYMHYNPLQPHWKLCNEPAGYRFSSANFMKMGKMNLRFLVLYG